MSFLIVFCYFAGIIILCFLIAADACKKMNLPKKSLHGIIPLWGIYAHSIQYNVAQYKELYSFFANAHLYPEIKRLR
jgi:hypothetical protein